MTTQIDKQLLGKCRTMAANEHRNACAAEYCRGAIIARTGLLVQGLHATPQRRRADQADHQHGKLHGMPAPMAEQYPERPCDAAHVKIPPLKCRRRSIA